MGRDAVTGLAALLRRWSAPKAPEPPRLADARAIELEFENEYGITSPDSRRLAAEIAALEQPIPHSRPGRRDALSLVPKP